MNASNSITFSPATACPSHTTTNRRITPSFFIISIRHAYLKRISPSDLLSNLLASSRPGLLVKSIVAHQSSGEEQDSRLHHHGKTLQLVYVGFAQSRFLYFTYTMTFCSKETFWHSSFLFFCAVFLLFANKYNKKGIP